MTAAYLREKDNKINQVPIKEQFVNHLKAGDIESARICVKKGAEPDYLDNLVLKVISEESIPKDPQLKSLRYLVLECKLDPNCALGIVGFESLLKSKRFDAAAIMVKGGLDLNSTDLLAEGTTLFTEFITNQNPSKEIIEFLIENGADVTANNQKALRYCINNHNFTHADLLIKAGADINTQGGIFIFEHCFWEIIDAHLKDNMSEDMLLGTVDFLLNRGLDLIQNDFYIIRRLDNFKGNVGKKVIDRLYTKLGEKLAEDTVNLPQTLKDSFKKAQAQDINLSPSADLLLSETGNGYRLIDYLSVTKNLYSVFNPLLWQGREDEALSVMPHILPAYQSINISEPLKLQKILRERQVSRKALQR